MFSALRPVPPLPPKLRKSVGHLASSDEPRLRLMFSAVSFLSVGFHVSKNDRPWLALPALFGSFFEHAWLRIRQRVFLKLQFFFFNRHVALRMTLPGCDRIGLVSPASRAVSFFIVGSSAFFLSAILTSAPTRRRVCCCFPLPPLYGIPDIDHHRLFFSAEVYDLSL